VDPEFLQYFDLVCDEITAHPTYSAQVENAVRAGEQLLLNDHTHGPGLGYCVSACDRNESLARLGLPVPREELAHIRGIGRTREECRPRIDAFAARPAERYRSISPPSIFLDGAPLEET
jgi:hypothetical protein